jgi:hypothetical protein
MSAMHDAWIRQVCGRIKSDLRYSVELVYNNFPWPVSPPKKQTEAVMRAAKSVLDVRAGFPESTLADLYSLQSMPRELNQAHRILDAAVDKCYGFGKSMSHYDRVLFLFDLWRQASSPLIARLPATSKKSSRRRS